MLFSSVCPVSPVEVDVYAVLCRWMFVIYGLLLFCGDAFFILFYFILRDDTGMLQQRWKVYKKEFTCVCTPYEYMKEKNRAGMLG